jgi:hypothetical protein
MSDLHAANRDCPDQSERLATEGGPPHSPAAMKAARTHISSDELTEGRRITWACSAHPHAGYSVPVPAVVIDACGEAVRIWLRARRGAGGAAWVREERTVARETLTLRTNACAELGETKDGARTPPSGTVGPATIRWCMRVRRVTTRELAQHYGLGMSEVRNLCAGGGDCQWPRLIAQLAEARDRRAAKRGEAHAAGSTASSLVADEAAPRAAAAYALA